VLVQGIHFRGGQSLGATLGVEELLRSHQAIYLTAALPEAATARLDALLGQDWRQEAGAATEQGPASGHPVVYAGGDCLQPGQSVVQAAAGGRRAAVAIARRLGLGGHRV
jgi:hypothetical protein